jgi:single-strand DNA-binding protein
MSTTITGKLNKPANQFQAGESTGFGIRLGVKARNPKTKQDEWCNYSATIFAKSPGQIQFYQQALVEGSVIEVTCEQQLIESFDGQNGTVLSITMINARLGYVHTGQQAPQQQQGGYQHQVPQQYQQPQPRQQQAPQRQQYQKQAPQQQQQAPMNNQQANDQWDDDIPY